MALTPAGGVPISNESLEGGYILAEVGGNTRRVPSGDFTSIANMAASTKLFDGQTVYANGEAFTYDAASMATADGALIVVAAAGGRLISQRKTLVTVTDMLLADTRGYETFTAGDTVSAGGYGYTVAPQATPVVNGYPLTTAGGVKLYAVPNDRGELTPEQMGKDGTQAGDSAAIKAILEAGFAIRLGRARYYWDGTTITKSLVIVRGCGMPVQNSAKTALQGGSIIQGRWSTSAPDFEYTNFGVDVGSASGLAEADGVKCTTTFNAGGHAHVENVSAMLNNPNSAFHAILLESYQKVTGGGLVGYQGYFGVVIKCRNVRLSTTETHDNYFAGTYLKSDDISGACADVVIDTATAYGDTAQTFGLYIQSDGADIKNIKVGAARVFDCMRSVKIDVNGTKGTGILGVNIDLIESYRCGNRDVHIEAGRAAKPLYDVTIGKITAIDTTLEVLKAEGVGAINHVNVGEIFASFKAGVSQAQMNTAIQIESSVARFDLGVAVICQSYSLSTLGGIELNNAANANSIGYYRAKIFGSGAPEHGVVTAALSGTTATITVPDNGKSKHSQVIASPASGTIVNTFTTERVTGSALFARGHRLTVQNNSANSMTVAQNYGGKILNKGGRSVVIKPNETAEWMFFGVVWHQVSDQNRFPSYADNAAALAGGLVAGDRYETSGAMKIVT